MNEIHSRLQSQIYNRNSTPLPTQDLPACSQGRFSGVLILLVPANAQSAPQLSAVLIHEHHWTILRFRPPYIPVHSLLKTRK